MCYRVPLANAIKNEPADSRLVLLIRKTERKRIEKLARAENVSIAIVRRSLGTYQSIAATLRKQHEEDMMKSTIRMLEEALSSVNESIAVTCEKLDRLHLELKKRETV
jgi:hypothetical protein